MSKVLNEWQASTACAAHVLSMYKACAKHVQIMCRACTKNVLSMCKAGTLTWPEMVWRVLGVVMDGEAALAAAAVASPYDIMPACDMLHVT